MGTRRDVGIAVRRVSFTQAPSRRLSRAAWAQGTLGLKPLKSPLSGDTFQFIQGRSDAMRSRRKGKGPAACDRSRLHGGMGLEVVPSSIGR